MVMTMRWIALLLLVGLAACADETTLGGAPLGWGPASGTLYTPSGGGGIVGDWIYCEDESCTELALQRAALRGRRHLGLAVHLQWYEDDGVIYCLGWDQGTYTWSGNA